MELRGSDFGDFSELYCGFEIEVKIEQVWDGEYVYYCVLQGDVVWIDWWWVKVDGMLFIEWCVIECVFDEVCWVVDVEFGGGQCVCWVGIVGIVVKYWVVFVLFGLYLNFMFVLFLFFFCCVFVVLMFDWIG